MVCTMISREEKYSFQNSRSNNTGDSWKNAVSKIDYLQQQHAPDLLKGSCCQSSAVTFPDSICFLR